jgi:hypothetical protein
LLSSGANLVNEWQNRREQRRINKRNEELWREQQEYNDPSNQMLRLQRAGLNPMLIYGGGAASAAGNAGAPPSMQSYQTGIPDAVGSIMTLLMQVAQLQQLEHQNKLIDSQASLAATQAQYYDEMVRNKSINTKTQVYNLSVAQDRGTKTNEGMPTVNQVGGNLLQKLSVRILRWLKNA